MDNDHILMINMHHVATPHPPVGLAGPGTLSGELLWGHPDGTPTQSPGAPSLRSKGGNKKSRSEAASAELMKRPLAPSHRA